MVNKTPIYKIREYRKLLGWTQEVLAEKAGLDFRTISAYELGERGNLATLRKIAQALNVSTSDLLTDEAAQLMTGKELLVLAIEQLQKEIPQTQRSRLDPLLELTKNEVESLLKP